MKRLLHFVLLLAAVVSSSDVHGQTEPLWDGGRLETTREGLEELLARYEQTAASSAYSPDMRSMALREAEAIRLRLSAGDFRTGDVVDLRVEREEGLNGSFAVNNDGAIMLPVIGQVSLRGVLRSELSEHLRRQLSAYLVEPRVTAHSSVRLMITGSATPGIFVVPTQELLSSAVMERAGGPTGTSDLTAMRIERGQQVLWEGEELQTAIAQGLTIEQLSLRSGDHVVIPPVQSGSRLSSLVTTTIPAVLIVISSLISFF